MVGAVLGALGGGVAGLVGSIFGGRVGWCLAGALGGVPPAAFLWLVSDITWAGEDASWLVGVWTGLGSVLFGGLLGLALGNELSGGVSPAPASKTCSPSSSATSSSS